jgi:hypothetical protein
MTIALAFGVLLFGHARAGAALTIARTSGSVLYRDASSSPVQSGSYVSYQITNDGGALAKPPERSAKLPERSAKPPERSVKPPERPAKPPERSPKPPRTISDARTVRPEPVHVTGESPNRVLGVAAA